MKVCKIEECMGTRVALRSTSVFSPSIAYDVYVNVVGIVFLELKDGKEDLVKHSAKSVQMRTFPGF